METETRQFDLSNRVFKLSIVIIAIGTIFLLGQMVYQMASLPENTPQYLSVQGTGKSYVKPDIATVSLGLKTEGNSVQTITNTNVGIMNKVVKDLKDLGIEEKDIQTTQYSITPQYNWTERGGQVPNGYAIEQNILVKIRNFDKIGDVLTLASKDGANMVGGLQFAVDNPETAKAEARAKAITEAKQKAVGMAKSAGFRTVKLVNISENYYNASPVAYGMGGANVMEKSLSIAPDIQTGQQEVDVTVNLTYVVK